MINANAPVVVVELGRNPLAATSNLEVAVATIALSGGSGNPGGGDLQLGTTSTTAHRGDRGNTAYLHSQATHASPSLTPTVDEKAALGASTSPSAANPFVTKSELATKIYAPTSIAVPEGSLTSGSVTSLATSGDGLLLIATESVSTGLAVEINFTSITNFNSVAIRSQYSGGANHTWHFELYNYLLSAWEILSEDVGAEPALTWHTLPIANSAPYLSGGNVKLKFHHAPPYINNHTWTCDYAALVQSNAGAVEFPADKIKLAPDPLIGMLETNLQDSTEYLYANKQDKMGEDDNYVTDAEKIKLGNLSGTNTGDQDLSGKQDKLETEYPEVPRLVYLVWGGSLAGDGAAPNTAVQASIDHLLNIASIPADNIAWLYREEAPSTTILVNGFKGSGRLGTSSLSFASGSITIAKLTGSGAIGTSNIIVQGGAQTISIAKLTGNGAIGTPAVTFASGTVLVSKLTGSGKITTSGITQQSTGIDFTDFESGNMNGWLASSPDLSPLGNANGQVIELGGYPSDSGSSFHLGGYYVDLEEGPFEDGTIYKTFATLGTGPITFYSKGVPGTSTRVYRNGILQDTLINTLDLVWALKTSVVIAGGSDVTIILRSNYVDVDGHIIDNISVHTE